MRRFLLLYLTGLLVVSLSACQRAAYVPTARLAPATSQPVSRALPDDPAVAALIRPYHDQVASQMGEVLGTAPAGLPKGAGESPLLNFVGDVQRVAAGRALGQPIDLGVVTSGALRAALPAGAITLGAVFELMPFENELVVLDAPAETVQQLFVFLAKTRTPIAGATYAVGPDRQPIAIRVGGAAFPSCRPAPLHHRHFRLPGWRRRQSGLFPPPAAPPHQPAPAQRYRRPHSPAYQGRQAG